ncbi:MAG: ammonium transporter [Pirellulales bacterium]
MTKVLPAIAGWGGVFLCLTMSLMFCGPVLAQEAADEGAPAAADAADATPAEAPPADAAVAPPASANQADLDALWMCLAAFLVFFMQAGFACVETGFTRAKNACNIMMKNLMDFCIGSLSFWLLGFALMFGVTNGGWIGTDNYMFDGVKAAVQKGSTESFAWGFLLFQTVFCATAATIVSGAVAERTKFSTYLVYSIFITAVIYPVFGSWAWGNLWMGEAWLAAKGFHDFAGSTVVHSVGGWCALAGAIVIGPRIGKYKNGKVCPIPGHNVPLACIGVFILWLGWFGFNPGSTTAVGGTGATFAYIAVTTNASACAGGITAMIASWIMFKKPDPSFAMNGALAGLVAITAGCDVISVPYSILTGGIAGVLVVASCLLIDRIKIDDPVGAISVHGVCGAWGTLATGLFVESVSVGTQLLGIGVAFAWAFGVSLVLFLILKFTLGIRASEQEEIEGLDMHEHGMLAYPPGFVADTATGSVPASA